LSLSCNFTVFIGRKQSNPVFMMSWKRSNFCSQEIVRYKRVQLKSVNHFPKAVFAALFPCLIFTFVWAFLVEPSLYEHNSQSILSKIVAMHFHRTRWENYLINNNIIDKIICIFLHFVPSHMKKLWFFIG
jgi:hypothetical protein